MGRANIRIIQRKDIEAVVQIYTPYVLETAFTFELQPPTIEEMTERVEGLLKMHPWLVYEEGGVVKGYAYAGPHRSRAAYQWSVESSVYVGKEHQGQKVGRFLYEELLQCLEQQGIVNVYAGITLPNPASERFHASFPFKKVGVYEKVGFKFEQWHDVGWYSLRLGSEEVNTHPNKNFEFL